MTVDSSVGSEDVMLKQPEKPLAGSARTALLVSCGLVTALYYAFAGFALVVTLLLVALDAIVFLGAARVGLAGRMVGPLKALCWILGLLAGSMRRERDDEFNFAIPRGVAPKLYDLVEAVAARIGVAPPNEIVLEMANNASVQLHGYRTGKGSARLAIGFDMLAIFSQRELEGLIAHELGHAKLVMRGFRKIVLNGVGRCWQIASGLASMRYAARQEGKRFYLAEFLNWIAKPLAKLATRLAAAYCRQEEFEADRLAADTCGPAACRSAMRTTVLAGVKGADLTFSERLMHLERDESFTDWLRTRLTPMTDEERADLEAKSAKQDERDEFDTHPSYSERMAMWECTEEAESDSEPAIDLITDPDFVARKLATEIENIIVKQEQRQTDELQKWVRKQSISRTRYTGGQAVVIIVGIFSLFAIVLFAVNGMLPAFLVSLLLAITCVLIYPRLAFRERFPLPFPGYGAWRTMANQKRKPSDAEDEELEKTLADAASAISGRTERAVHLAARAYAALAECDYKTAAVASRLALKLSQKCTEALLANGVAEAYFGNEEASNKSINLIYARHSLTGTLTWGFGWAFLLQESLDAAEVYLLDAAMRYPKEPTLLAVLARCQWERGRLAESYRNIKSAVDLKPDDFALRFSYTRNLLDLKRAKAARDQAERLEQERPDDLEVMCLGFSAAMLLGHQDEAARRAERVMEVHPGPKALEMLGGICSYAHDDERAKTYFEAAREHGFSPSVLVTLAGIEYGRENKSGARDLLLEALDMTKEPLPESEPVLRLLPSIFQGLASCNEEVKGCSAWSAKVDLDDAPGELDGIMLLVCAPTVDAAKEYVSRIHSAMYPERDLDPTKVEWKPEPDEQPEGRICPGIYGFIPKIR